MKKLFLWLFSAFIFTSLSAVEPDVIWNGDFNTTPKTFGDAEYTLTLNNNQLNDEGKSVTITNDSGIRIDGPTYAFNDCTVIVCARDLNLNANKKQALVILGETNVSSVNTSATVGLYLTENGQKIHGIDVGNAWGSDSATAIENIEGSNYLVFRYKRAAGSSGVSGTGLFQSSFLPPVTLTSRYYAEGLRYSSKNIKHITIGGAYSAEYPLNSDIKGATNWKIEKVAIFKSALLEADIKSYIDGQLEEDAQKISQTEDFDISSLAEQINENAPFVVCNIAEKEDGTPIEIQFDDTTTTLKRKVAFSGASVHLKSTSGNPPSEALLGQLDFSQITGKVSRAWISQNVESIGLNFKPDEGEDASLALVDSLWFQLSNGSGSTTSIYSDRLTKVTWSAPGVYQWNSGAFAKTILNGYLDDNSSTSPRVEVSALPFDNYDVLIYCATDTGNAKFKSKTVNGKIYVWDETAQAAVVVEESNTNWGASQQTTAILGKNVLRVNDLSGPLTIDGGKNQTISGSVSRGCIAAIQIIPHLEEQTLSAAETQDWSSATWQNVIGGATYPTNGNVTISLSGNATITLDQAINLKKLSLTGNGDLTVVLQNGITLAASEIFIDEGVKLIIDCKNITLTDDTVEVLSYYPQAQDFDYSLINIPEGLCENRVKGKAVLQKISDSISINFVRGASGRKIGSSDNLTGAYAVPAKFWNNVEVPSNGEVNTTISNIIQQTSSGDMRPEQLEIKLKAPNSYNSSATITTDNGALFRDYLDNAQNNSISNEITVVNMPYTNYDVYVYMASDGQGKFGAITVNGTRYPTNSSESGWTGWGTRRSSQEIDGVVTFVEEGNYLKITGQTNSTLTILGGKRDDPSGTATGIGAIQIVNKGGDLKADYYGELSANANWSNGSDNGGLKKISTEAWSNGENKEIVITNIAESASLTFDTALTAKVFSVISEANKNLALERTPTDESAGANSNIKIYDFTNAKGTTKVNFNPGESTIYAGRDTSLPHQGTGLLVVPSFSRATVTETNIWGGTINAFDATSILRLEIPTNTLEKVPRADDQSPFAGTIELTGEMKITSEMTSFRKDKNYRLAKDAKWTVDKLRFVDLENDATQTFTIDGGSLTATSSAASGSNQSGILFGHYQNGSIQFDVLEGSFTAINAAVQFGWNAACHMTIGGKLAEDDTPITARVDVKGLSNSGNGTSRNSSLTILTNGVLQVLDSGIDLRGNGTTQKIAGGKVDFYANAYWHSGHSAGIQILDDSSVRIGVGKTVTLGADTKVTGSGNLDISKLTGEGVGDATTFKSSNKQVFVNYQGAITVGENVTLALRSGGDINQDASFEFKPNSQLLVTFDARSEELVLRAENLTSVKGSYDGYDVDEEELIIINDSEGFTHISMKIETWSENVGHSFRWPSNWDDRTEANGGNIFLRITPDDESVLDCIPGKIYNFGEIDLKGTGVLRFAEQSQELSARRLFIPTGATFINNGRLIAEEVLIDAGGTYIIDADVFGKALTENATINGNGSVISRGHVTFAKNNKFKGGLIVETGIIRALNNGSYGGTDVTSHDALVTVRNGASADLANTGDWCYSFNIAGIGASLPDELGYLKPVGALFNSGNSIGDGSRQTWSISLSDDAEICVDEGHNFGFLNGAYAVTQLLLNGHTLTKRGGGSFWFVNVNCPAENAGTFRHTEGEVKIYNNHSNLPGSIFTVEGRAKLNCNSFAFTNLAALVFHPTPGGTIFLGSTALPETIKPILTTKKINFENYPIGESIVLINKSVGVTEDTFEQCFGGRCGTLSLSGDSLYASISERQNPFFHFDFHGDDGSKENIQGEIKLAEPESFAGLAGTQTTIPARNGKAIKIYYQSGDNLYSPYWSSNSLARSPFNAGATVTTVAKFVETDKRIIWSFGEYNSRGIALVIENENTIALLSWHKQGAAKKILELSNLDDLTRDYQLISLTTSQIETTLQVGQRRASTSTLVPEINMCGQLGSIHGLGSDASFNGYTRMFENGYYLDDFAIYEGRLLENEVNEERRKLAPKPMFMIIR